MLKQPKISIGLPVRNGETYLCEALDSILSQSYSEFEIIAADNASTDSTLSILNRYAQQDRRISVFHNAKNKGAAFNYNFVFAQSSGKYFKWATHDDVIERTLLEKSVSILEADPSVVLVYPETIFIDEQGNPARADCPVCMSIYDKGDDRRVENLLDNTARRFHRQLRNAIRTENAVFGLIKSAALAKAGLIGGFYASDVTLLRNLALHGKILKISEPLFLCRVHPEMSHVANCTIEDRHHWYTGQTNDSPKIWFARHVKSHIISVARADLDTITMIRCWFSIATWSCRKSYVFFISICPGYIYRPVRSLYKEVGRRVGLHRRRVGKI